MARILVIDDSVSILAFVEETLTRAGHEVRTFPSGKEGIEYLKREVVSLIITDIYMPEMDGIEIMRNIRRLKLTIPVIAISSKLTTGGMYKMVLAMGAWDTLTKPFSSEALLAVVAKTLRAPAAPTASHRLPLPGNSPSS